jgi:hypothetical protein
VRRGQRPEPLREADLRLVVEVVLVAEEHDLVLEQRGPHLRDGLGAHAGTEAHPVDACADAAVELGHADGPGRGVCVLGGLCTHRCGVPGFQVDGHVGLLSRAGSQHTTFNKLSY